MPDPIYPAGLLALFALAETEIGQATEELRQGQITVEAWHIEMQRIVTRYSLAALFLGMDTETLTDEAEQAVMDHIDDQMAYLGGFVDDVKAGISGGWSGTWSVRAGMYGDAMQPLYWMGQSRFLRLPAYPGDGSSECLTSDRCMWVLDWLDRENLDVDAYWVDLRDDRVCPTCLRRGQLWSPLKVRGGKIRSIPSA